ncbi:ATP-dependent DNA helicase [Neolewinella agarilytica]|uniref:ATP-dependent DNA helicase n=1 Tax=Neolewinella agarilytica TaxID=478744 RepID=UPI0023567E44|nr:ATP-dependent DNA helicase [Neolewinella agarilytica]
MRPSLNLHNASFQTEIARLNAGQRAAVEQVDGPVMVLAGPGTGKTHLLAARIGNILTETDTGAHNILCLTFTEAGVKAMRERLLQFIGPEAHRIGIYTFHGFCSNLIQQNLQYFGKPDLEPLAELEQISIIRALLDGQEQDTPLRQGYHDPYFYEPHLKHLFSAIKAENWEVDDMEQKIDRYVASLPTHPEFVYKRKYKGKEAGTPKEGAIAEEVLRMNRLRAAIHLFPAYQDALRKQRRYDYGDMIGWVLRAFNDFPTLLRTYQERYQYVLVDEFQDTNGAQDMIVRSLVDYWERPNVFIVGDDDQAIYEFQGARLRSMIDFFQRYDSVKLVTLTENYRSRQEILDAASTLIGKNELRIGNKLPELTVEKKLVASNPDLGPRPQVQGKGLKEQGKKGAPPALSASAAPAAAPKEAPPTSGSQIKNPKSRIENRESSPIRLLSFPDQNQETGYLINQLRRWNEAGTPWSEMAVIYAKHHQAAELIHLLERAGIPYRSKRRPNVLDGRPVRQLLDMLHYLQAEYTRPGTGEYLLFRVLHFRCFGLWPHDLARMNRARLAAKDSDGFFPTWRDFLQSPAHWPADLRDGDAIQVAADWLEDMIGEIGLYPLTEYVERAMNGSGLLPTVLRHPNRAILLQHLATFADFTVSEVARRPRIMLEDLLETLRQMDANRIQLPLRSHLDQAEAVLLVTAHSAKGLEFDKVWMLDCAETKWGKSAGGRKSQFKLPDTLTYTGAESEEEARRRLFFVAMTRAKTELVLSVADIDGKGKAQQRVSFLDELVSDAGLQIEQAGLSAEETALTATLQLQPTDDSRLPGLEAAAVQELLKDFRLSVSSLYSYLNCPTAFFYEKLLGVPDLEREQTLYGSALHDALETFFLRMKRDTSNIFPSRQELLYNFEQALGKRRGLLTPEGFRNRLRQGNLELGSYYDTYHTSWTTDVDVEMLIRNTEVDGIPLVGMIDRVDVLSDAWVRVVDYKTSGSGKSSLSAKIKGPTKSKPYGGNYWRQLNFYKLLYDNRPGNIRRVKEGKISFLLVNTDGKQPEVSVSMGPKDQDALRLIMREAWNGIQAQQFTGCGEDDCDWCRFVADLREEVPLERVDEVDDWT